MKNCFKTVFEGYELILPKSSVTFKDGAGIVNAHFKMEYNNVLVNEPLIGIVDEKYNFIINLFPKKFIKKIDLFSDDIIILYTEALVNEGEYVFLIPKNELESRYNLGSSDYEVVGDNIILLKSVFDDLPICALFDVNSKQLLTPYCNYIGEFKYSDKFNEEVALVYFYIRNQSKDIIGKIEFYINKQGSVVSNYKNTLTGDVYDKTLEFKEVLELVGNDIRNTLKLVK